MPTEEYRARAGPVFEPGSPLYGAIQNRSPFKAAESSAISTGILDAN
jgi:hypothetical protein